MKLKELRKKNNETQTQLSEILDVSLRTVQNYESEKVTIPNDKLKVIAKHYNVSLSEIFNDKLNDIDLNKIERKILSKYITDNWEYMMEDPLFNANFKAKAGEWAIGVKKRMENN